MTLLTGLSDRSALIVSQEDDIDDVSDKAAQSVARVEEVVVEPARTDSKKGKKETWKSVSSLRQKPKAEVSHNDTKSFDKDTSR